MLLNKKFSPLFVILLSIVCISGTAAVCRFGFTEPVAVEAERSQEELYQAAVLDAVMAEEDEILPLVTITQDSPLVTWKDGDVLLMTLNDQPERYVEGETIELPEEVWTFTDKEIAAWYPEHKKGVTDWTQRLKQLVGVQPDGNYTHVTAMWVSTEDICRPAYLTDITTDEMQNVLPEDTPEEYREWFENNILWSYFDSSYPWTRLGYTYDWAENSGEYGVTEFLVRPGAAVTIEYTDTVNQFVERLEAGQ